MIRGAISNLTSGNHQPTKWLKLGYACIDPSNSPTGCFMILVRTLGFQIHEDPVNCYHPGTIGESRDPMNGFAFIIWNLLANQVAAT